MIKNYKWAKDFAYINSLGDLQGQQSGGIDFNKVRNLVSNNQNIQMIYQIGRPEETCEDCLLKQLKRRQGS